ncbi:hypothetical protein KIN20_022195 [Parelaphostrongylus tenuis]|uniref:Signal recognition particle 14 kDa protein n=1 Tax=Parelaphostrongylus tenuis TaxID=148309 RepID=A0AAD5QUL4_PARTN|nr:hypothetical protein KIN20_022195 [Parelaphostrongylus tenuis]
MTILSNDEFLSQLGRMYMDARLGGPKSVYVTMKPCEYSRRLHSYVEITTQRFKEDGAASPRSQ